MTISETANYSGHCTIFSHGTTQVERGECVNHAVFEECNIIDKNGHKFIFQGLNSDKEQAISVAARSKAWVCGCSLGGLRARIRSRTWFSVCLF